MAYLEERNGAYRLVFRINGKKISRSTKTKNKQTAELALAQLKDGLRRVELGFLELEPEDDLFSTLMSTGKIRRKQKVKATPSIGQILDDYIESIPLGSIEESTRGMLPSTAS
jgi:hypothetical protein